MTNNATDLMLILLERIDEPALEPGEDDPWPDIMVDANTAMVVAAPSFDEARKLAAQACTDEGGRVWVNPRFTQATQIGTTKSTEARVILRGDTPNDK